MIERVASGILPIANSDRTICLAWRSPEVQHGNRYGVIGGICEDRMDAATSARQEMLQEVGYEGPMELYSAFVYEVPRFRYHNYIGTVPKPFPFKPHTECAWETTRIDWMRYGQIAALMAAVPEMFHRGLIRLFQESRTLIESFL